MKRFLFAAVTALALLWCAPQNLRYPPALSEEEAPAEEAPAEEA